MSVVHAIVTSEVAGCFTRGNYVIRGDSRIGCAVARHRESWPLAIRKRGCFREQPIRRRPKALFRNVLCNFPVLDLSEVDQPYRCTVVLANWPMLNRGCRDPRLLQATEPCLSRFAPTVQPDRDYSRRRQVQSGLRVRRSASIQRHRKMPMAAEWIHRCRCRSRLAS